jgi:hypothetical protein
MSRTISPQSERVGQICHRWIRNGIWSVQRWSLNTLVAILSSVLLLGMDYQIYNLIALLKTIEEDLKKLAAEQKLTTESVFEKLASKNDRALALITFSRYLEQKYRTRFVDILDFSGKCLYENNVF